MLFDSTLFKQAVALAGWVVASVQNLFGAREKSLLLLTAIHRLACSPWSSSRVERLLHSASLQSKSGHGNPLGPVYEAFIAGTRPMPGTIKFHATPEKMCGSSAMVLKSAGPNERGVLLLNYSYIYPLFAMKFDVRRIMERYYLVLEPSWSGYCDLNILSYSNWHHPVFVESIEPRDTRLLNFIESDLVPVPVAGNWWVDHRVFRPLPGVGKDIDVCMVAGWASYKRHSKFFAALSKLRKQGLRPRAAHRLSVRNQQGAHHRRSQVVWRRRSTGNARTAHRSGSEPSSQPGQGQRAVVAA